MIRRRILATLANNAPKLPNGYQQIEYIENGGNSYIDTGVKATYQTRVVLDISDLTTVDTHIFGAKKADSGTASDQFSMIRRTSTTIRSDYFGTNASADMADTITRFTIDKDANVTKINGVVAITNTAVSSGASQYNMYLFGCNTANDSSKIYPSSYRLYSCQIYDNGTLVRDFIPCTNPDGISGLWDSVNDVFYKMLPAGYAKLDFIETDGTTYIDTGFKPNQDTRVVFEGYNNSTSSIWIFGAWKAKNDKMFAAAALNTYNICYGTEIWANATMPVGPISIDINKNAYTYNGVSGTLSEQTFSCDYSMYLFHINAAGTVSTGCFYGRIYSVKIYDNGTLVRDFIPAMNASGEAGLYDLKNDVWYALLPVVKPKVENKITVKYVYDYSNWSVDTFVDAQFSVTTRIKVVARLAASIVINGVLRPIINNITFNIEANKIRSNIINVPFGENDPVVTITSISPTEDDTYIYTF